MELLIAFSTDEGKNLIDDHAGMAKYFYIYRFCGGKQELVEIRENVKFKGDESEKHGDPQKARATSSVLSDIHVLANKKFGPNLPRLSKNLLCVVVRTHTISNAIEVLHDNIDTIVEEYNKGQDRKHLVLKP
jgi:predicted Fe-Mo cluster-binding NifX family protein